MIFLFFFLAGERALSLLKRNGPVWGWIPHFQTCRERIRTFHRPHTSRIIQVPMDSQPWEIWTVFYQVPMSNHPNVLSNHASVGATWSSLSIKPFIIIWDQFIYFCKSSLRPSGKSDPTKNTIHQIKVWVEPPPPKGWIGLASWHSCVWSNICCDQVRYI